MQHRNPISVALRTLAAGLLLAAGSTLAQPADRDALASRLQEVRAEIGEIQSRINDNLSDRDRLLSELAQAERAVGAARRAQAETDQALAAVRAEIARLDRRRTELETRVGERASELGMQLLSAYRQGTQSRLKMLLNQDDPRRLSRRLAYHGYLSRARLEAINALRDSVEALRRTRDERAREAKALEELLVTRQRETQRLEAAMDEREQALSALDQRLASDRRELAGLERDAEELGQLLEQLADVLADVPADIAIPPFDDLRGDLPMPVSGAVMEAYGDHRSGELRWTGWLIDVSVGDEVRSIAHGRVAYADWLRGYGLLLIIDHGDEYMSLYAHNEALMRDVGDWVAPGDVIALAGRSGGISEPALYFELRRSGRPVDPARWIAR